MGLTEVVVANGARIKGVHHSREGSTSSTSSTDTQDSTSWSSPAPLICYPLVSKSKSTGSPSKMTSNPPSNQAVEAAEEKTATPSAEETLEETRMQLVRSQAEVVRLAQIRDDVENEVRELTASLFQEAHGMVHEANIKAAASEKALKEARMQVDVLQAEVNALKTLVITSTPSRPNAHLHPQLSNSMSSGSIQTTSSNGSLKLKMLGRHRRDTSDCDLKFQSTDVAESEPDAAVPEVDPVFYGEFEGWRQEPSLSKESPFIQRLFNEDAGRCLDFPHHDLSQRVSRAVEDNTIYIEEFHQPHPVCCALFNTQRICRYRMKLGDENEWHHISSLCRNRITAVCDTLTYLRYIRLGLVKSSLHDVYWEIIRLRKQMTLARLGLP